MGSLQGVLAGRPAFFQFFMLILLALMGTTAASSAMLALQLSGGLDWQQILSGQAVWQPGLLQIGQLISAVAMFLFPAIGGAYLFSHDLSRYLSAGRLPSLRSLALATLCLAGLLPVIGITTLLNRQLKLPPSLEPVERWMQASEEQAESVARMMLEGHGAGILLLNIFVIAVIAGLTEELLFRGTLQRIAGKVFRNHHAVIWTVAILFSTVHLQFYGFVPRMLLGAYFGYLLYWSKNIWIPVFVHFFNNLLAVLQGSFPQLTENNRYFCEDPAWSDALPAAAVGLLLFLLFFYPLRKTLRTRAAQIPES